MKQLVFISCFVISWGAYAQDTNDLITTRFISVLEMSGHVWACWENADVPWQSSDVIPYWNFIRTSRNLHGEDLCEDTLRWYLTDTLLLDVISGTSFKILYTSGFLDSLGEDINRVWGESAGVTYPLEGEPTPSIDCGSTKYWDIKFEKKMVLLFRVPSGVYARRLRIATVDKEIMIGLVTDEKSAFAQLVRRKFPGRID